MQNFASDAIRGPKSSTEPAWARLDSDVLGKITGGWVGE